MRLEDITIVITTFKSDKKINLCIESIDREVKVIIVENSQNEKLKENIEKKYSNVHCIIAKENLGYARGNNLGLKKVNTKYALVLNPDTILETDALKNFLKRASENEDFSLIGPTINQENKSNDKENLIKLETINLDKDSRRFYISSESKPKDIILDPSTKLLARWDFKEIN